MKSKIFSILLSAAAVMGFSACDSFQPENGVKGNGQLRTSTLGVEVDGAETIVSEQNGTQNGSKKAAARVASRATIDLSNFIVTVNDINGQAVATWAYKDMPELPTFPEGDYTVNVKSHIVEPAAWNAPYYEGEQSFSITANQVTEVETVVCKLANIRVSVSFTQALLKAVDNADEVTVKITSEGNKSLVFTPAETRSGYFEALQDLETLRVDFSASIYGHTATFTKTVDNVAKGQHRKITFGLTGNPAEAPEEVGTIINDGSGITVDTDVIEDAPIETDYPWYEDNIDDSGRPGDEDFDEPEGPDNPTPPTPADWEISFTSATLDVNGNANNVDEYGEGLKDAIVNILSTNGFSHINVEIVSAMLTDEFLEGVGLTTKFDLAEPGQYAEGLAGLGFPTPDQILAEGVTSVDFNITMFVPLILESGDHKFLISVTDKDGNVKSMTLLLRKA